MQAVTLPGTWNDVNCGRAVAGYLCKKFPGDDHTSPAPTQPWVGYCPKGLTHLLATLFDEK